jgi:hypothetical protein
MINSLKNQTVLLRSFSSAFVLFTKNMKWEEEEEYKMKPSACAMRFVEDPIASGSLPAMSYKIPPEDAFIKMEEELEDSKSLLRLTSLVDQANDPFLSQIQSEEDENSKSLLQQSLQSINDDRVQQGGI